MMAIVKLQFHRVMTNRGDGADPNLPLIGDQPWCAMATHFGGWRMHPQEFRT